MLRLTDWLWAHTPGARAARAALSPVSLAYATGCAVRSAAYGAGWLPRQRLPRPSVSVGNLTAGGTGKTPIASWIAGFFVARGARPAILLRGYGGDEGAVHRRNVPEAIVVENADRVAAAATAVAAGAELIILDDAFQHLRVIRDLDVVLVSAESLEGSPRRLPSGPWREAGSALARAHVGVVTRRRLARSDAKRAARWMQTRLSRTAAIAMAELRISGFEELRSGKRLDVSVLQNAVVLGTAGIGDPVSFGEQLRFLGARVRLDARRDHYPYTDADARDLARLAKEVDFVVLTAKDAAKLRDRWPTDAGEPLVARLEVHWESGGEELEQALAGLWDRGVESRGDR